ncbi:MAG: aminotransferase class I/II-fold pyridoxal phosphate-dependent enzyme [Thaumarchaeota archaeon]|nr:aminotransferase class I/II-fold pyridoxal phosphate-dependent enzyme [Nitrososphaerota archaeon]
MVRSSTRSVHGAEGRDRLTGAVTTPIYQTATFGFSKARDVVKAVKGESSSFVYSRWDNPTVRTLERKLAELEAAEDAAFFSSGMAAISTAVIAMLQARDHVLAIRDLYGETYRLIHDFLPRFGVKSTLVDTTDLRAMSDGIRKNTKVVYVETPTNPTLKLVDIREGGGIAHAKGAKLLVDNTFASPINQRPLKLGADLVLHSATKYLNGHSDVIAGAVAGSRDLVGLVKKMRRVLGGTLDPHAAYLILRGIKTLSVRVDKQCEGAERLADYLSEHEKVVRVNYPGLESHPQRELAKKQMKAFGGMLSFEIRGKMKDAMKLTESLKIATLGGSLGSVETLVSQPATLTHTQLSPAERKRTGISETLVRVSVGLEDVNDLIEDFEQALAKV